MDRLRARRETSGYKVPAELNEIEKRKLLKDLKFQVSQLRNEDQLKEFDFISINSYELCSLIYTADKATQR